MDPSQKAAEPLKPVKPAQLIRTMIGNEAEPAKSAEALDNRKRAADELTMIFELRGSAAFRWFQKEFIDARYQETFDALRDPAMRLPGETLECVQARYLALRKVKAGILEREIAHRELISPTDTEIAVLREELARL